jgi:hypothetical protein
MITYVTSYAFTNAVSILDEPIINFQIGKFVLKMQAIAVRFYFG